MGSLVSPIVANIYMEAFKDRAINTAWVQISPKTLANLFGRLCLHISAAAKPGRWAYSSLMLMTGCTTHL